MTPLPKRRHSSARSGKRRAAIHLAATAYIPCENCGKMKLSHTVCPECGSYSGRVVVAPKVKTTIKKISTPETGTEETKETTETA